MVDDAEYPEHLFFHERNNKKDSILVELEHLTKTVMEMESMIFEMHREILSLKNEMLQINYNGM